MHKTHTVLRRIARIRYCGHEDYFGKDEKASIEMRFCSCCCIEEKPGACRNPCSRYTSFHHRVLAALCFSGFCVVRNFEAECKTHRPKAIPIIISNRRIISPDTGASLDLDSHEDDDASLFVLLRHFRIKASRSSISSGAAECGKPL